MNYTLYIHTTPSGKKYVGITKRNIKLRWSNGNGYTKNKYFYNAIKKYGWENIEHKVIFENLSREEADYKERELIRNLKTTNPKYGYNLAIGGGVGMEVTDETRKKISESRKGIKPPFNGSMFTEEQKRAISIGLSKKIKQYTLDGDFIREWDSIKAARNGFRSNDSSNISACLSNKIYIAYGYYWNYSNVNIDKQSIKNYVDTHKLKVKNRFIELHNSTRGRKYKRSQEYIDGKKKKVIQYDLNGNYIKTHNSLKEAAIEVMHKLGTSQISGVCNGIRKTAYGYRWKYANKINKQEE